jgi:hypothetical protein
MEVGDQCFRHRQRVLVENAADLRPFGEIIGSDQEVSVLLFVFREGSRYVDGFPV